VLTLLLALVFTLSPLGVASLPPSTTFTIAVLLTAALSVTRAARWVFRPTVLRVVRDPQRLLLLSTRRRRTTHHWRSMRRQLPKDMRCTSMRG
jgi:integral membrane sensor domain MASE1